MQIEKSLRALWLLWTTAPLRTVILFRLYVGTLGHKIDSMLTRQSFNSGHSETVVICYPLGIGSHFEYANLLSTPWIIQSHMNLESSVSTRCQSDVQLSTITLSDTSKA